MAVTQVPIFTADLSTHRSCVSYLVSQNKLVESESDSDDAKIRRILVKCVVKPQYQSFCHRH